MGNKTHLVRLLGSGWLLPPRAGIKEQHIGFACNGLWWEGKSWRNGAGERDFALVAKPVAGLAAFLAFLSS